MLKRHTAMSLDLMMTAKWISAVVGAFWMSLGGTVQFLLFMMATDFLSGLIAGFIRKEIDSNISYRGLAKKSMTLVLVAVVHQAAKILNIGIDLGEVVALAYCINEVISIVENCAHCGVPIPSQLVESLAKLKQFSTTEEVEKKLGHTTEVTKVKETEIIVSKTEHSA